MTAKDLWVGAKRYVLDDGDHYTDDGRDLRGIRSEMQIRVDATPVEDTDVLRLADLNGGTLIKGFRTVLVASITDPSELEALAGGYRGDLVLAIQTTGAADNTDHATLYAWDTEADAAASPYIVDGYGSGYWVAVAGRYQRGFFQLNHPKAASLNYAPKGVVKIAVGAATVVDDGVGATPVETVFSYTIPANTLLYAGWTLEFFFYIEQTTGSAGTFEIFVGDTQKFDGSSMGLDDNNIIRVKLIRTLDDVIMLLEASGETAPAFVTNFLDPAVANTFALKVAPGSSPGDYAVTLKYAQIDLTVGPYEAL